ncbi:hypothetical protein HAQ00_02210 [Acidithiobacillus caldus ATCC 51756]|jgi:hypothetical protein|uniref:hypothetical protein n=1 Tax=Acidithiobacillus caldus TaxID=33059 RepID=UPI001C066416|nr:hypothetical protein [Acidithiobacillus caldus]MBU2734558.1 hypothetical protein [Acidithiobacillus caldus ATCC 51756]MBU2803060.1 hypothetical protein [Acidithiobacillus caldus]
MRRIRSAVLLLILFLDAFPWVPSWWFSILRWLLAFSLGVALMLDRERLHYIIINLFPHKEPYQKRERMLVGRHRHQGYQAPEYTLMGIIEEDL